MIAYLTLGCGAVPVINVAEGDLRSVWSFNRPGIKSNHLIMTKTMPIQHLYHDTSTKKPDPMQMQCNLVKSISFLNCPIQLERHDLMTNPTQGN